MRGAGWWDVRAAAVGKLRGLGGALRVDETCFMPVSAVLLHDGGGAVQVSQSKTAGADKKVAVLTGVVSHDAFLAFPEWLSTGYAVWRAAATPRGYLLGAPTADLAG